MWACTPPHLLAFQGALPRRACQLVTFLRCASTLGALQVAHEVLVEHAAQGTVTLLEGCGHFTPASASHWSWGHASALSSLYSADDGSPLMLSNLLTDQSPFASGGKLRLTLRLQLA